MKLNKPYTNKQYADFAVYCNRNKLDIADKSDYLEAVILEKSQEIKEKEVRTIRNQYLKQYVDDRAKSPFMWKEVTKKEKAQIGEYRKYLMDFPEREGWYETNPMTFEEWKQSVEDLEEIIASGD